LCVYWLIQLEALAISGADHLTDLGHVLAYLNLILTGLICRKWGEILDVH